MDTHASQFLQSRFVVARVRIAVARGAPAHGGLQVDGEGRPQAPRGTGLAQAEHEPPPEGQLKESQQMPALLVIRQKRMQGPSIVYAAAQASSRKVEMQEDCSAAVARQRAVPSRSVELFAAGIVLKTY